MGLKGFTVEKTDQLARAGELVFSNGDRVKTPVFMPVGTRASVKAVRQESLEEIGYRLILTNTYHLYLRPGTEVLEAFGGVKKFMSWPHSMLTDSGGYQAFSLSSLTKYTDQGVAFKSHIDGSNHLFTPEKVLDIQGVIGSDIVMPLDDCAPYPADEKRLRQSLDRTHRWIKSSAKYWRDGPSSESQTLFGIVQGGVIPGLRKESAEVLSELDLPGYAIGGLSVGETKEDFRAALPAATAVLPVEKPRYLMGVGSIPEIIFAVANGVDMFDCVLPTRNARNGQVFTSLGKLNLRGESHKTSDRPMDESCGCAVCRRYSLGYIRHLHKTSELLAYELSSYHNLFFMKQFMENLGGAIREGEFGKFSSHWLPLFV